MRFLELVKQADQRRLTEAERCELRQIEEELSKEYHAAALGEIGE